MLLQTILPAAKGAGASVARRSQFHVINIARAAQHILGDVKQIYAPWPGSRTKTNVEMMRVLDARIYVSESVAVAVQKDKMIPPP